MVRRPGKCHIQQPSPHNRLLNPTLRHYPPQPKHGTRILAISLRYCFKDQHYKAHWSPQSSHLLTNTVALLSLPYMFPTCRQTFSPQNSKGTLKHNQPADPKASSFIWMRPIHRMKEFTSRLLKVSAMNHERSRHAHNTGEHVWQHNLESWSKHTTFRKVVLNQPSS